MNPRLRSEAIKGETGGDARLRSTEQVWPLKFALTASSHITASGMNTAAVLTAPSGKTTGDFAAGRAQDDENPADSVDLAADKYTEYEWSLVEVDAVVGQSYQFRVTNNGTPLDTYTAVPEVAVVAPSALSNPPRFRQGPRFIRGRRRYI